MKTLRIIFIFLICAGLLIACGEEAAVTPNAQATISAAVTTAAATTTSANATTTAQNPALPTLTPTVAQPVATATPAATATPGTPGEKLQAALQNASRATSFSYTITQTGELKSGGSVTAFNGAGEGSFAGGQFRQSVTVGLSGTSSKVEHYGRSSELFERVTEQVVWRKAEKALSNPLPPVARVGASANVTEASETISGTNATKYSWTLPTAELLQSGQPEILGVLTASNLYRAFAADKSGTTNATMWFSANGQLLRYQTELNATVGINTFKYTVTYNYADFNGANVRVETPPDLPRS
jgi:hypothetical protein